MRSLAQIDLEKVVRDVDIDVLQVGYTIEIVLCHPLLIGAFMQMSLENICFCNLREEDLRFITDQHVVKIFRASQLVIEYLLYAQEQLADNCNVLSNKYNSKKRLAGVPVGGASITWHFTVYVTIWLWADL